MQAQHHLDLADRFANLGYGPAFRLKPFRPRLTAGALSCAKETKTNPAKTTPTPQATGADPGGFPDRRPNPITIKRRCSQPLDPFHARRGITPAFGYGPRLGPVRLDFHQQETRAARRT
ncbi:MAG: hypothetical protein LC777_19345, partial [Actinobacteria bacterium]|nr:hypothetical protein [Actinomycetota bacterium]